MDQCMPGRRHARRRRRRPTPSSFRSAARRRRTSLRCPASCSSPAIPATPSLPAIAASKRIQPSRIDRQPNVGDRAGDAEAGLGDVDPVHLASLPSSTPRRRSAQSAAYRTCAGCVPSRSASSSTTRLALSRCRIAANGLPNASFAPSSSLSRLIGSYSNQSRFGKGGQRIASSSRRRSGHCWLRSGPPAFAAALHPPNCLARRNRGKRVPS